MTAPSAGGAFSLSFKLLSTQTSAYCYLHRNSLIQSQAVSILVYRHHFSSWPVSEASTAGMEGPGCGQLYTHTHTLPVPQIEGAMLHNVLKDQEDGGDGWLRRRNRVSKA